ncbi:ATP-binding protein [Siccirubricoccus sp. G192]|uniref:ATP-binding protein n=1 Tax=Siccirubricoccus sp. G192 TaxID=2849651 RepID=UPI001C2C8AA2|nr:ATP-binding protein [Siccirubricoccus sp. G192]MBV1797991.1 response regulator [Siccirubricoccus sp. G192]
MAEHRLFRRRSPPAAAGAFRLLFEAAPEGMALLDPEGRIRMANPALGRLVGPTVALRPGLPAVQLVALPQRQALAARIAAAGMPEAAPLLVVPADSAAPEDTEWALHCEALPALDGDGPALLLRVTDRTPQRRAEARLAGAARLETVGRLAGGIAHDFNNLLAAILGSAEAMRAAGLPAAAAAELGRIEDAAQRGAGLVRQLLAFARQQRLQPRILDLNAAVSGLAPLLRRLLGEGVQLDLALEVPGRCVRVDPAQLDQVILNLAVNAREAMPGGGRLRIATGRAVVLRLEGEGPAGLPPGRYAVLEVSDTGCGIPPETLPRLFEPFFTTRPDKGGTGLGLATVQGIVAQSGGHITVESRPGEGSTFRIHLPRQEAVTAPVAPAPATPLAGSGGGRILLVEDEAPLRRLAALLLQRAGHEVLAAESAEAALGLLADSPPPDALVSDVAMPGQDGLELARDLRSRWPGLPVVLLSGYAESALGHDPEGEGMRFLHKPYAPAELLAALASVLRPASAAAA